MAKYCDACGTPMGTRDLLRDGDRCQSCYAPTPAPKKGGTGILQFVADLEARNPLAGGTGPLGLPER